MTRNGHIFHFLNFTEFLFDLHGFGLIYADSSPLITRYFLVREESK